MFILERYFYQRSYFTLYLPNSRNTPLPAMIILPNVPIFKDSKGLKMAKYSNCCCLTTVIRWLFSKAQYNYNYYEVICQRCKTVIRLQIYFLLMGVFYRKYAIPFYCRLCFLTAVFLGISLNDFKRVFLLVYKCFTQML